MTQLTGTNLIAHRDNDGIKVDADLRKAFPSIWNTRRSVNVSEDYQLYRSDKVIEIMDDNGMMLVEVGQERIGWSKKRHAHTQIHMMRFREKGLVAGKRAKFGVGDSFPEIVVKNSHDGRCLFQAMAGVFRLICSNGMVVADSNLGSIRRRHFGENNTFEKVREILADLPKETVRVSKLITAWDQVDLNEREQIALAKLMMEQRMTPDWLKPEQTLEAVREADRTKADGSRSLWLTFNVLQESLTNRVIQREEGEGRGRSIRPMNAIIGNMTTNQKLWSTAEAYATKIAKKKGIELVAA